MSLGATSPDATSGPVVALSQVFCVHRTGEGDAAALQGIDLELGRGEVLAVLGPSGAGKSTLLRVIAGLQTPSAGVATVLGRDIGRLPDRERARIRHAQIGFVGQRIDGALPVVLPVARIVELPLALRGLGRAARRARVAELLAAVALADRAGARVSELSGGERQRVALCTAVAHRPALLLADEPTGELDSEGAIALCDLITALARAEGASAVIATHDPAMTAGADRVVVVRDGRAVETRAGGGAEAGGNGDGSRFLVGRGGWVRLPSELLAEAGIGEQARVRSVAGGLFLEPDGAGPAADGTRGSAGVSAAAPVPGAGEPRPLAPAAGPVRGALVEVRSLSCSQGRGRSRRRVIDGLEHTFRPGTLTVVTGRSGSGKTTLLRLLAGLAAPEDGTVQIDGHSLRSRSTEEIAALRRERIGYLSQEPEPVPFLSATENVVLSLRLRGCEPAEAAARAASALSRVGLGERARQLAGRLSAGEAQRLGLARALAASRGLLIVDEPTSRLDEQATAAVARLLAEAAADGHTVICATHDPEVVAQAGDVVSLESAAVMPRSSRSSSPASSPSSSSVS
jgi:ABC-type lipoprotein export system ATPase subunit